LNAGHWPAPNLAMECEPAEGETSDWPAQVKSCRTGRVEIVSPAAWSPSSGGDREWTGSSGRGHVVGLEIASMRRMEAKASGMER
jgi:hypothetical protein